MENKSLKLYTVILILMSIILISESVSADTFTLTGILGSGGENTHSFTLSSDGELVLDITVASSLDLSFRFNTCLLLYDSDGTTWIWSGNGPCGTCGTTNMTLAPLNLKAGIYYLEVSGHRGEGSYTIAATHTPSAFSNDTEPNDEVSQAQATTLSVGMTGHLGYVGGGSGRTDDEIDWWSFSAPSDGELTLDIEVASTLDLSFQSHTCITIFESDGTTLVWSGNGPCGSCGTTNSTLGPIDLETGSYSIRVRKSGGSYGGYGIETTFSSNGTTTSTTTTAVDSSTTTIDGETSTTTTAESDTTTTIDNGSTTTTSVCPSESIYGEYAEETELLRVLRDNVLSHTPEGQEIIRLYYQWSPEIVKAMEGDAEFQEEVKEMVDEVLELITKTK